MVAHRIELDELLFSSFFVDHGNNNEQQKLSSNLNGRLRFYELTSISDKSENEYSVGIGLIDNIGYIMVNMLWVALEFSVNDVSIKVRKKYGSNTWSDWTKIS